VSYCPLLVSVLRSTIGQDSENPMAGLSIFKHSVSFYENVAEGMIVKSI
jgi:hypothetical protein